MEGNWSLSAGNENTYVTDEAITLDSEYAYPVVTYTWGAKSGNFVGDYYDSGTSGLNDLKVAYYTEENGVYYLHAVSREVSDFTMTTDYRLVVYEISNIYGEKQYIYFEYTQTE